MASKKPSRGGNMRRSPRKTAKPEGFYNENEMKKRASDSTSPSEPVAKKSTKPQPKPSKVEKPKPKPKPKPKDDKVKPKPKNDKVKPKPKVDKPKPKPKAEKIKSRAGKTNHLEVPHEREDEFSDAQAYTGGEETGTETDPDA